MNKKIHSKTPLFTALSEYSQKDILHFDVPGHKKRDCKWLAEGYGKQVLALDANSTKDLDMVSNPSGVIKEAEVLMADAYNADYAFFLVNGSTSGVQYMIMTACKPDEKIIIPRNVHKSAINGLILSGCKPVFIDPEINLEYGISHGVTFSSIKLAIDNNPDAKAVFLMNPTYFGVVSDLEKIIKYAHSKGLLVLVDEAHGAHFPFCSSLPTNATSIGADMATVSLHKTAGSFTQSSVLLLNEKHVKKHQVRTIINLMQTSSASYLLMSSLDLARQNLVLNGQAQYNELLDIVRNAKQIINSIPGLKMLEKQISSENDVFQVDETKLVIKVNELGLSGFEVYDLLFSKYRIQVELAESYVILAIIGVGDDSKTVEKLVTALQDLSQKYYGKNQEYKIDLGEFLKNPEMCITPREAHYQEKELVAIDSSINRVSGESIMIYPPGIPLVIPGEIITTDVIKHYEFYQDQGCVLVNDEGNSGLIKVLIEEE